MQNRQLKSSMQFGHDCWMMNEKHYVVLATLFLISYCLIFTLMVLYKSLLIFCLCPWWNPACSPLVWLMITILCCFIKLGNTFAVAIHWLFKCSTAEHCRNAFTAMTFAMTCTDFDERPFLGMFSSLRKQKSSLCGNTHTHKTKQ